MSIKDPPSPFSLASSCNVLYLALVRFGERESTVHLHSPSPRYIYISLRHYTSVIRHNHSPHFLERTSSQLTSPLHYVASSNLHQVLVTVTVTVTVPVIAIVIVIHSHSPGYSNSHSCSHHEIHHVTTCRTTGSGPSNPGNLADIESI